MPLYVIQHDDPRQLRIIFHFSIMVVKLSTNTVTRLMPSWASIVICRQICTYTLRHRCSLETWHVLMVLLGLHPTHICLVEADVYLRKCDFFYFIHIIIIPLLRSTHSDVDDLFCSVSCPSLYSSGSSSCTVSWSRPTNASCDALFGYFVTITSNGLSMKSPLLDIDTTMYFTGQLKAFQVYTASVTATSTCGSTQPIDVPFMTSREQSKCA